MTAPVSVEPMSESRLAETRQIVARTIARRQGGLAAYSANEVASLLALLDQTKRDNERLQDALIGSDWHAEEAARQRDVAKARATAAEADKAELRRTLEPFAKEADEWNDDVRDDYRPLMTEPGAEQANPGAEAAFSIGDLRAARAALSATSQDRGNREGDTK